jgi:hypothetical protein
MSSAAESRFTALIPTPSTLHRWGIGGTCVAAGEGIVSGGSHSVIKEVIGETTGGPLTNYRSSCRTCGTFSSEHRSRSAIGFIG